MNTDWIRSRFHLLALAAALALGGVSWFGAQQYLSAQAQRIETRLADRHARTRVLVAGADLGAGEVLSAATLATREIPVRYVPSGTARVADLERVAGQRLAASLKAGDPIAWASLAGGGETFSTQLAPGRRAITFPVDDVNAIAGLLSPGDRVDLLYVERRGAGSAVRPLLQQVEVLATGTTTLRSSHDPSAAEVPGAPTEFATVTLSVTPDEAKRIVLAQRSGELTFALRHPADAAAISIAPLDSAALVGGRRDPIRTPLATRDFVEIIVGGTGAGDAQRLREPLDDVAVTGHAGPSTDPGSAVSAGAAGTTRPALPHDAGNVRARLGLAASTPR